MQRDLLPVMSTCSDELNWNRKAPCDDPNVSQKLRLATATPKSRGRTLGITRLAATMPTASVGPAW